MREIPRLVAAAACVSLASATWLHAGEPRSAASQTDDEVRQLREQVESLSETLDQMRARLAALEAERAAPAPSAPAAERPARAASRARMTAGGADIEFSGQVRARGEYFVDPGFDDRGSEDVDQVLLRTRVGVLATIREGLAARIQLQDSRVWGEEASTASDEGGVDLKLGVLELTGMNEEMLDLFIGRQVLSYGDQKLIGAFEWSNTGRSFDAVRFVFHSREKRWRGDLWGAVLDEEFGGDDDETFWGFYNQWDLTGDGDHTLHAYAFLRRNGEGDLFPGGESLEEYTLGARYEGGAGRWGYVVEAAHQFGDRGTLDIDAWALHGRLTADLPGDWRPRLLVEANRGTGDDDPEDGEWGRFDNLYPTNHLHYGYADLFSWANLEHYRLGLALWPYERGMLQLDLHTFALETTSDAWLNAGGKTVRAAAPGADDDAGWELDAKWSHTFRNGLALLAGWSYFEPGDFAEATGEDDAFQFLYLQTLLNF